MEESYFNFRELNQSFFSNFTDPSFASAVIVLVCSSSSFSFGLICPVSTVKFSPSPSSLITKFTLESMSMLLDFTLSAEETDSSNVLMFMFPVRNNRGKELNKMNCSAAIEYIVSDQSPYMYICKKIPYESAISLMHHGWTMHCRASPMDLKFVLLLSLNISSSPHLTRALVDDTDPIFCGHPLLSEHQSLNFPSMFTLK